MGERILFGDKERRRCPAADRRDDLSIHETDTLSLQVFNESGLPVSIPSKRTTHFTHRYNCINERHSVQAFKVSQVFGRVKIEEKLAPGLHFDAPINIIRRQGWL